SGLMLFMKGPGTRSIELEKTRNPKTIAEPQPTSFHCARASRHEVMPRKAIMRPHPSIECGKDQRVSSRPNAVCQIPSKKPARPVMTNPPPASAIGPGTANGSSGSANVSPNQSRSSGVNAMYARVMVADRCIEEMKRCGGEKQC